MKSQTDISPATRERFRYRINGLVQGVGFRPFVYRLATSLQLAGHVCNNSDGVTIEIEGSVEALNAFREQLQTELPAIAQITRCDIEKISATWERSFVILASEHGDTAGALVSPDLATCDDCLRELFDPHDRRYRYPFINCTNCGPRYTIVERIPYDRPNTSMKVFPMCPECRKEYDDPSDRRFHAQPNACPACGPKVSLWHSGREALANDPIAESIRLLGEGKILAIRGVGGFHLAVDPRNEAALSELRKRKGRAEKPFALMARDMATIKRYCVVSREEETALIHRTRPIVLLKKSGLNSLLDAVAPDQHSLGFMLPYTPLQHLLLAADLDLLVMTSGNFSEEPIAIGNHEAMDRLQHLADYFLLHDREILQRCDDSIVRIMAGHTRMLRRSRGYVPEPLFLDQPTSKRILAVGAELKNTIALSRDKAVFLSQHIGDLDNPSAFKFFQNSIEHLETILELKPELVAYDLHPEYLSTKWALSQTSLPKIPVQHHHAHLAAVLAESRVSEPCIGIILDGTGYGTDGTIWGGEILVGNAAGYDRVGWLQQVPMPGGAAAVRQPWRMALSYLRLALGDEVEEVDLPFLQRISRSEMDLCTQAMDRRINAPLTSSCGRVFDGIAAILGLRSEVSFEAQAAMELEAISAEPDRNDIYREVIAESHNQGPIAVAPLISAVVKDWKKNIPIAKIGARFHATLAELFISRACELRTRTGIERVALSGGVYQNLLFFEYIVRRLHEEKFTVYAHERVPTNDGGLALGQIAVADAIIKAGKSL